MDKGWKTTDFGIYKKTVNWFFDDEVVRYSDNQYRDFSLEGQKDYVEACLSDENKDLYGIFDAEIHVGNITIDDNCWIAANVTILNNVHIGKGSVIGAGAVVTKNIPENSIAVGIPAEVIKKI